MVLVLVLVVWGVGLSYADFVLWRLGFWVSISRRRVSEVD